MQSKQLNARLHHQLKVKLRRTIVSTCWDWLPKAKSLFVDIVYITISTGNGAILGSSKQHPGYFYIYCIRPNLVDEGKKVKTKVHDVEYPGSSYSQSSEIKHLSVLYTNGRLHSDLVDFLFLFFFLNLTETEILKSKKMTKNTNLLKKIMNKNQNLFP